MPQVRKLTTDEVQELQNKGKGQRKIVEEQYDAILSDYDAGEYGEALLDSDENRLTVRNRLRAAAGRRKLGIEFRRTTGDLIRFQVVSQTASSAQASHTAVSSDAPPAKRKGGRPRKAA